MDRTGYANRAVQASAPEGEAAGSQVPSGAAAAGTPVQRPLTLWQWASFGAVRGAVRALYVVLGLRGLYRFGRLFGSAECLINFKRRRRFHATLAHALGRTPTARERRVHARDFFAQRRCDKLFYLVFDAIPRERAISLLTIRNQALLDAAAARGRGVQVATAHHGPMHVMGMLLALRGYKVAGVREPHEGAMRQYVQQLFDRRYPEFRRARVLSSQSFPRAILRTLQEGYVIGSSMDVSRIKAPNQKTVEVDIFGERRRFLSGPIWLALRSKSPVLQAFAVPERDFHYRLDVVEMLLDPETVSDPEAAVDAAMRRYAANIERYVRARPGLVSRVAD